MTFRIRLHAPNQMVVRQLILDEFNKKPYATHPRYQKLFIVVKNIFLGLLWQNTSWNIFPRVWNSSRLKENTSIELDCFNHFPWEVTTTNFIIVLHKTKRITPSWYWWIIWLKWPISFMLNQLIIVDIFMKKTWSFTVCC